MSDDTLKGAAQKAGGHVKEAAGALVGDQDLKTSGQEDQIKGGAREAWGHLKDAGNSLVDRAKTPAAHDVDADPLDKKHGA